MATIKKTPNGKWQVAIRVGEYKKKPLYKTFAKKVEAKVWAQKKETEINESRDIDTRALVDLKVNDLLDKLKNEYVVTLVIVTGKRFV